MVSVTEAVERELARLPDLLAGSALAASALSVAASIDAGPAPTAKSMLHRELRETLGEIRALAPPEQTRDGIDELQEQRERRQRAARAAAAEDLSRP